MSGVANEAIERADDLPAKLGLDAVVAQLVVRFDGTETLETLLKQMASKLQAPLEGSFRRVYGSSRGSGPAVSCCLDNHMDPLILSFGRGQGHRPPVTRSGRPGVALWSWQSRRARGNSALGLCAGGCPASSNGHTITSFGQRVPDYHPEMLHELQSPDATVFEYWDHAVLSADGRFQVLFAR